MIFTDAKDLFGVAIIYSIGKAKQWKYLNFGIVLAIIKMDPQPPTPPPALENLWTNIATTAGASDSLPNCGGRCEVTENGRTEMVHFSRTYPGANLYSYDASQGAWHCPSPMDAYLG
jgi:hypothetical protein